MICVAMQATFLLEQPSSSLVMRHDRFIWLLELWNNLSFKLPVAKQQIHSLHFSCFVVTSHPAKKMGSISNQSIISVVVINGHPCIHYYRMSWQYPDSTSKLGVSLLRYFAKSSGWHCLVVTTPNRRVFGVTPLQSGNSIWDGSLKTRNPSRRSTQQQ